MTTTQTLSSGSDQPPTIHPLGMTRYEGPGFPSRCFVYWNFNKKCWSIRSQDPSVHPGKVVAHADLFFMQEATFQVSEKGRQRVLRDRVKNVHAGVVGEIIAMRGIDERWYYKSGVTGFETRLTYQIIYNPYEMSEFKFRTAYLEDEPYSGGLLSAHGVLGSTAGVVGVGFSPRLHCQRIARLRSPSEVE